MMRFVPLIVFLLLAALMGIALLSGGATKPPNAMVGQHAPVAAIEGLSPDDLSRGVVIVNFFASWCAPCAEEHPVLTRLAGVGGARLVGIVYKDSRSAIDAWLEEHGNPFSLIGYDPQGRAAIDWGVYGVPETYVVIDGVIRYRHVGPLDDATVARDIQPLVREGSP